MVSLMVVVSSQFPSFPQSNRSVIKSLFIETIIMVCTAAISLAFSHRTITWFLLYLSMLYMNDEKSRQSHGTV